MADTAVVDQSQTPTPQAEPAAPQRPAEPATITEHERRYGPNGTGDPEPIEDKGEPLDDVVDEDTHQPRTRGSRAKSKMAAARINRLTAEKNELRQRLEALEKAQQKPAAPSAPQSAYQVPAVPKVEFDKPEPQLNDFADKDDPYGEWMLARADWRSEKRAAEQQTQHMQAHQQRTEQESRQYWQGIEAAHQQRLLKAIEGNPAHYQALASVTVKAPPLLDWAIMLDNDSADVALYLATHPAVLDEFVLMTDAKPVTEQTVATTRRLLRQRMTAGTTGSVAPSNPIPTAPRPPNPVRTGTMRTGPEPTGEASSIADHAKLYSAKR